MHLKLAELLESVPPEFTVKKRTKNSQTFAYKNKEIYISWWDDGQPDRISYYENDQLHRPYAEGTAFQTWYSNGQPCKISYWEDGKRHRPHHEGPALQSWSENGQLKEISYYENGKEVKIK